MVTFLVAGNIAEVTDTDPSLCDVESSVLLQFKHKQGRQGMQQLFVPNLDKVFKCNLTATPDFSTDCSDVTTGRIPDGIPFNRAWEVEALPGNGFLVLNQDESIDSPDGDGSIIKCPGVGPCKVLIQGPVAGLKLDGQGNFCFAEYFFGQKSSGLVRFGLKVKCCPLTLSDDSQCTVLNTVKRSGMEVLYGFALSPGRHPILGFPNDPMLRCTSMGNCTVNSTRTGCTVEKNPEPCTGFVPPSGKKYDGVTVVSGNYYLSKKFANAFQGVDKCIGDELSSCQPVIEPDAPVTPPPTSFNRPGAVLVENETSIFVADTWGNNRIVRCNVGDSPAQCEVVIGLGSEVYFVQDLDFVLADAASTTTTTTTLNFAEFKTGVYCYDPDAAESMPSISYRSFDTLESRDECEDLCAADVHCNYYGWYPTTERCDRCVFYTTCKYQRKSVCIDESSHLPKLYKKSSENTTRPVAEKSFRVRADLTGKYCRGTEILSMPEATQAECHGNCSVVSKCTFAAYYFEDKDAGPVEDAKAESCQAQCRLFSGCSNTVRSLCWPPATIWEASLPEP